MRIVNIDPVINNLKAAIHLGKAVGESTSDLEAVLADIEGLPALEPFTGLEERIFLSAMYREEKVCEKVDDEFRQFQEGCANDAIILVDICHEITRKVKGALWRNIM